MVVSLRNLISRCRFPLTLRYRLLTWSTIGWSKSLNKLPFKFSKVFKKFNLISTWEFDFLKNWGFSDAIVQLSAFIYENFDWSKCTLVAFWTTQKLLTLSITGFFYSNFITGIRGVFLSLLESYLKARWQVVKVDGVNSQSVGIYVSSLWFKFRSTFVHIVHQQSVIFSNISICKYADDTPVLMCGFSWNELATKMTQKLNEIYTLGCIKII